MAGPAIGGLARKRFDRRAAGGLEGRLEHEVLRRIAGDEQFREQDQVGVRSAAARAARTLAALPATSPTTGLSWARAMASLSAGGGFMAMV